MWNGLDLSKQMLSKSNEKGNVKFVRDDVMDIPVFQKRLILYLITMPSIIIAIRGIYKLHNTAIHNMSKWWVYHYFPTAYFEEGFFNRHY